MSHTAHFSEIGQKRTDFPSGVISVQIEDSVLLDDFTSISSFPLTVKCHPLRRFLGRQLHLPVNRHPFLIVLQGLFIDLAFVD